MRARLWASAASAVGLLAAGTASILQDRGAAPDGVGLVAITLGAVLVLRAALRLAIDPESGPEPRPPATGRAARAERSRRGRLR